MAVQRMTEKRLYSVLFDTPYRRVGLLLGTSKYTRSGQINQYYYTRLRAAVHLYMNGKINIILASGDNQSENYNEPQQMLNTLLALGVERNDIILDYSGLRTFDSIVRAERIFGFDTYTIITQHPHSIRALYIADQFNHRAIAYNVPLPNRKNEIHFRIREMLARFKAVLDIHVLDARRESRK